jgi:hypothetical protein
MHRSPLVLAALVALASATPAEASGPDPRFIRAIRAAASRYQQWGRVDEKPNIAPFLCRVPAGDDFGAPSRVRTSRARSGPHEEKLYYLWSNEQLAYTMLARMPTPLPVGFTVVKQSFSSKPMIGVPPAVKPPALDTPIGETPAPISWLTTRDGRRLQIDRPKDLYMMIKVGDVAGADAGWIYGTVSPSGTVTSAGRVASCMGCHESAKHERLFGLRE